MKPLMHKSLAALCLFSLWFPIGTVSAKEWIPSMAQELQEAKETIVGPFRGYRETKRKTMGTVQFDYYNNLLGEDLKVNALFKLQPDWEYRIDRPFHGSHVWVTIKTTLQSDMKTADLDKFFIEDSNKGSDSDEMLDWYIPKFVLTKSEDTTLLGKPGRRYQFTGTIMDYDIQGEAVLVSVGTKLYMVSFAALPRYFTTDYPAFQKVLDTFAPYGEKKTASKDERLLNKIQRTSTVKTTKGSSSSKSSSSSSSRSRRSR